MKNPLRSCLLAVFLLASAPVATAVLTASGDFATGSPTPTLTLTAPVSFEITLDTTYLNVIALPDWVTYDGGISFATFQPGSVLSYQIDGGTIATVGLGAVADNLGTTVKDIPDTAGYLYFSSRITVSARQVITLLPGSWTLGAAPGFSAPPASYDEGGLFLADNFGNRVSANGASIPEPSTAIAGLAGAVLLLRRRK